MNNAQKGSVHRQFYSSPHRQRILNMILIKTMESRELRLTAPFSGYPNFTASFGFESGWIRTRYLKLRTVTTDINALEKWILDDIDQYTNIITQSEFTPPGFINPSGSSTNVFDSSTHTYTTWATGGRQDRYLEDPLDLGDHIDDWQTRFDSLTGAGASELNNLNTFNARVSDLGAFADCTLDWPSVINGDSGKASFIEFKPNHQTPWDETLVFAQRVSGTNSEEIPARWMNDGERPYGSTFYDYSNAPSFDSGLGKFKLQQCAFITLTKTAFRLKHGVGCGLTQFDAETNFNFKDMIYGSVDLDTGVITDSRSQLKLAPGVYGFDNRELRVFSGSVINRNGSFPAYGWCRPMAELQTPRTDWNQYEDICP